MVVIDTTPSLTTFVLLNVKHGFIWILRLLAYLQYFSSFRITRFSLTYNLGGKCTVLRPRAILVVGQARTLLALLLVWMRGKFLPLLFTACSREAICWYYAREVSAVITVKNVLSSQNRMLPYNTHSSPLEVGLEGRHVHAQVHFSGFQSYSDRRQ